LVFGTAEIVEMIERHHNAGLTVPDAPSKFSSGFLPIPPRQAFEDPCIKKDALCLHDGHVFSSPSPDRCPQLK
jgi:hypothetical protein